MDPDSVQFRGVRRCASEPALVTGEFNAKNAYGAYVGFQPFYYDRGGVLTLNEATAFGEATDRCFRS